MGYDSIDDTTDGKFDVVDFAWFAIAPLTLMYIGGTLAVEAGKYLHAKATGNEYTPYQGGQNDY